MTDEPEKKQHWWQGLPGVITAVAALLTAVGGVLALLFQYGVLGGGDEQSSGNVLPTSSQSGTSSSTRASSNVANGKSWSDATATFITNDGTMTEVRAETVRYCISAGAATVDLSNGQSVPFEKMTSLAVERSDDQFAPDGKADLIVSLVDGRSVKGAVGSGCDFFGHNDLGRYSVYPHRLHRIDFQR